MLGYLLKKLSVLHPDGYLGPSWSCSRVKVLLCDGLSQKLPCKMFSSSQAIVFFPLLRHFTNISLPLFIKDNEGVLATGSETRKNLLGRRSSSSTPYAWKFSFKSSLQWLIHIINLVDQTKLLCNTPYPCDTIVSLETYSLNFFTLFLLQTTAQLQVHLVFSCVYFVYNPCAVVWLCSFILLGGSVEEYAGQMEHNEIWAIHVLGKVLSAVDFMHFQGILHRDIKG